MFGKRGGGGGLVGADRLVEVCTQTSRKNHKKNVALFNLKDSLALDFLGLTTGYKKV